MANNFSIIFNGKFNQQSIDNEIKKLQTGLSQSNLSVTPKIDSATIKQMQNSFKVMIDDATKLKTITSEFMQNGMKYVLTQKENSSGQWSKATISEDYSSNIKTVESNLSKLYDVAIDTQERINRATKSGATTYAEEWKKNLEKTKQEIESVLVSYEKLSKGISSQRISSKQDFLKNSEIEGSVAEEAKSLSDLNVALDNISSAKKRLARAEGEGFSEKTINSIKEEVSLYEQQAQAILSSEKATSLLNETYKTRIEQINTDFDSMKNQVSEKMAGEKLTEYNKKLNSVISSEIELSKIKTIVANNQKKNTTEMQSAISGMEDYVAEQNKQLDTMEESLKGTSAYNTAVENRVEAEKKASVEIDLFNASAKKQKTILDKITESVSSQVTMFLKYQVVNEILQKVQQAIYKIVTTIEDLNTAMTDVQMVTEDSSEETMQLADSYSKMAEKMGATTTEIAAGASEWLRQGKSVSETNKLLEASLVMSKVGAIESSESTELLTSTLNGYKMEASEAMHVVDALSAVDLKAATSVKELATALQSTANSARTNGVEFDKLIGMVGAVSEATRRSASIVGNSFKTIFARLTNVAAGKDTDDEGQSLNDVETVLNKLGISLRDSVGDFRNMGDVLDEIYSKWQKFNDVEKNQISTAVAGVRQRETFLALMENYSRALELEQVALDSNGSAMKKFAIYQDSIAAKMKELTATFEDFVYSDFSQNLFKGVLDTAKALMAGIDDLVNNSFVQFIATWGMVTLVVSKGIVIINNLTQSIEAAGGVINMLTKVKVVNNLVGLVEILGEAAAGATSFGGALSAMGSSLVAIIGPVGLVAAAVGLLTAGVVAYISYQNKLKKETIESLNNYSDEVDSLTKAYNSVTDLSKSKSELATIMGQLNSEYETEIGNISDVNEARQKSIDLIAQEAIAKAKDTEVTTRKQAQKSEKELSKTRGENVTTDVGYLTTALGSEANSIFDEGWKESGEFVLRGNLSSIVDIYQKAIDKLSSLKTMTDEQAEAYVHLKESLEPLKTELDEDNQIIDDHNEALAISQMTTEDFIKYMQGSSEIAEKYGISIDDVTDSLDDETDAINGVIDGYTTLTEEVQKGQDAFLEYKQTGTLTLDTLNQLATTFPDLRDKISLVAAGFMSQKDLLDEIKIAYQQDSDAMYSNILDKLKLQENYYNLIGEFDKENINNFLDGYDVDLKNHQTYAEAKLAIEQSLLSQLISAWGQYYNAQTQSFDLNAMYDDRVDMEVIRKAKKAQDSYSKAMDMLNTAYDTAMSSSIKMGFEKISGTIDDTTSALERAGSAASSSEDAYKNLLDMTISMLKKKKELQKDALNDELDGYKKVISAQKKLLELQDDEYTHTKETSEKNKEITDLKNKIDEASLDTSADGIKRRTELEQELSDKMSDLEDYQHDYSIDKQKDALDTEEDRMEEYIDNQIDEIDKYLDQTGKIYEEAINLINGRSESFYNDLIQYNQLYGDSLDSTVISAWNGATSAVTNYSNAVDSAINKTNALNSASSTTGVSTGWSLNTGSDTYSSLVYNPGNGKYILYDSKGNFLRRTDSSIEVKNAIANGEASYWYKKTTNGSLEKNVYHTGLNAGFVGDVTGNEQFVKALKGEAFVTKEQQDKFMNNILPSMMSDFTSKASGEYKIENLMSITVQGNLSNDTIPKLKELSNDIAANLNKVMFKNGVVRSANSLTI